MTEPLDTTPGQKNLPRWFAAVFDTASRLHSGSMTFVLPDGRVFRAQGEAPGPDGVLEVRDRSSSPA